MVESELLCFDECDLRGADFSSAALPGVVFDDCNLEGTILSQAKLTGGRFHGSNVSGMIGGTAFAGTHIDPSQVADMALNVFEAIGITVQPRGGQTQHGFTRQRCIQVGLAGRAGQGPIWPGLPVKVAPVAFIATGLLIGYRPRPWSCAGRLQDGALLTSTGRRAPLGDSDLTGPG